MSGRAGTTDHDGTPTYPEDHHGSHLLGVEESGAPRYFDGESKTVLTGTVDDGELLEEWSNEAPLDGRGVGGFVAEESSAWWSVTEFAKSHVPRSSVEDGEGDD